MTTLYLCRAGFERDCAAELTAAALEAGGDGRCEYDDKSAYVLWDSARGSGPGRAGPALSELVFARQRIERIVALDAPDPADRVTPIVATAQGFQKRFSSVWLEAPDSESGKTVLANARNLAGPLEEALRAQQLLGSKRVGLRLHVCVVAADKALLGISDPRESALWPMGIARLRFPAGAPSRSGMKLLEALLTFVGEENLITRLRAGRVAVDLGAAPGGWSFVLASRGMRVIAVDNGLLAPEVLATQMVEHRRADAFRYRPERPVDWMVCDVVAAPARVAALAAQWIARGWCRETIFNLKLPNANRWQEVVRCREVIERALAHVEGRHELRIKHLYHDREEVSAHLRQL